MYLSIGNIDWIIHRTGKSYYPQVFLEEFKYTFK